MINAKKNKTVKSVAMAIAMFGAAFTTSQVMADDSETRKLANFHSIVINGAIELDVKIGKTQKVNVQVEDMKLSAVETKVKNGVLYIDTLDKKSFWGGKKQSGEVELTLVMTAFNKISVKGAVDGEISGVDSKNVSLEVSGAADLDISGKCENLKVAVRGAGDLDADKLFCKTADIHISGAGDAEIYASQKVKAIVSGVGNVSVLGNPKDVMKKVHGLGGIKIRM